jgi:hypothetical protein
MTPTAVGRAADRTGDDGGQAPHGAIPFSQGLHASSLRLGCVHTKSNGRRTVRNRRPPTEPISAYFTLAIAVRSNLPVATNVALHQVEPNPAGLIPVKSPENRAVWSLVKALQSPLL